MKNRSVYTTFLTALTLPGCAIIPASNSDADPKWLAGDHHVHSHFSVGWDDTQTPPAPIIGGAVEYSILENAEKAKEYGLSWMVSTDHGGPNHSKVNRDIAYPELLSVRKSLPDMVLFYGMEFDTPAADHSSLIIPHTHDEADKLYELESQFPKREPFPADPSWDTEEHMISALNSMKSMDTPPVLIANHPSRSATAIGEYGLYDPKELRNWNNTAPNIAVGMAGAPGHQAKAVKPFGLIPQPRGSYKKAPTMGGFDQMTAIVGGFWDSMLGEGRRWWITANSDSHRNWRVGGDDFWPGEYSKTYVFAAKNYDEIIEGIRHGHVFVTTGDLIDELYVTAVSPEGDNSASIGDELTIGSGSTVEVEIRVGIPATPNANGDFPQVARVDLIMGEVGDHFDDPTHDENHSTKVVQRFTQENWRREKNDLIITHTLKDVSHSSYIRVRGTNTEELEPSLDPLGEDPWKDLWFYSNPVFITIK